MPRSRTREHKIVDLDERNDALNGYGYGQPVVSAATESELDHWKQRALNAEHDAQSYLAERNILQGQLDELEESPSGVALRARLDGVSRVLKKGVNFKFTFIEVDTAAVANLFQRVGYPVTLHIRADAEQPELPLDE